MLYIAHKAGADRHDVRFIEADSKDEASVWLKSLWQGSDYELRKSDVAEHKLYPQAPYNDIRASSAPLGPVWGFP